jgi:hypothetical protein
MELLDEIRLFCPYCGEPVTLVVDASAGSQQYVEDCEVCCRPMEITVAVSPDGGVEVRAGHEDQV